MDYSKIPPRHLVSKTPYIEECKHEWKITNCLKRHLPWWKRVLGLHEDGWELKCYFCGKTTETFEHLGDDY